MIGVVEFGLGNIGSILNMFKYLGMPCKLVSQPSEMIDCTRLLLPGVGHFDRGMIELRKRGLDEALDKAVNEDGVPILGICLGMQLLMEGSDEGAEPGLGWIKGRARRFPSDLREGDQKLKVPHMGWSNVEPAAHSNLFKNWEGECRFYFVHSYHVEPTDPNTVAGTSHYGTDFTSAIEQGNVMGAQFHPEKSHKMGMRLLRNVYGK